MILFSGKARRNFEQCLRHLTGRRPAQVRKKEGIPLKQTQTKRIGKKAAALLLASGLAVGSLPMTAYASESEAVFTFYDDEIYADGDDWGYSVYGTELMIEESGYYVLEGSCENGSVFIEDDVTGVTLVLDGLWLACEDTAPIICGEDSEVTIQVQGDNYFADGEDPDDGDVCAVIQVQSGASLTIEGGGILELDAGSCQDGIAGDETSTVDIDGPELVIDAAGSAIFAGELTVSDGEFDITAGGNGLEARDDDGEGSITILDGVFRIEAEEDAICGGGDVTVKNGSFEITAGDGAFRAGEVLEIGKDGASSGPEITVNDCTAGMEADEIHLNAGEVVVCASGDGLNADGDFTVYDGTMEIHSEDTAIDCGGSFTVEDGTVFAADSAGTVPDGLHVLFGDDEELPDLEDCKILVEDSDGNKTYQTTGLLDANYILLASGALEEQEAYTLFVDSAEIDTVSAAAEDDSDDDEGESETVTSGAQSSQTGGAQMDTTAFLQLFQDVPLTEWYSQAVTWAVQRGIAAGTSTVTFSPEQPCTRAEIVVFLWKAAGSPQPSGSSNPFSDVPAGSYYHDAVLWAFEQGITAEAAAFYPDTVVNRGQTAALLYRAADSPSPVGSNLFADVSAEDYYASAVQWAVDQKITAGTSAAAFSPDMDCSRSQIVTFLYRWLNSGAAG